VAVKIYESMVQGGEEWVQIRCGLLTASEMKLILTPKLKIADNDKSRAHVWELLAQRISGYVEPTYQSDDMLRGKDDENDAKITYTEHYSEVTDVGFITNDKWGFTLGYSPDGLVGDNGLIECKSRRQKFQIETIASGIVPEEYILQLQTALLVSEREWIDFVSYSAGLPMWRFRVTPDEAMQAAIVEAAKNFEVTLLERLLAYNENSAGLPKTERKIEVEMF
jgi:YqaJ-like viral recombinase domain